jgi:hypothetical protein
MSAPDPIFDAYAAGLDLVALHLSVTASGAAIGLSPFAGVAQCQSVILHCKRHRNIDRLTAVIRSELENAAMPVALSQLVSAVLIWPDPLASQFLPKPKCASPPLKPSQGWKQSSHICNAAAGCQHQSIRAKGRRSRASQERIMVLGNSNVLRQIRTVYRVRRQGAAE